tara:strand:+ start:63 stop:176 length:114 start_codon:yes stop_codon:yes gene_type:complete
MYGEDEYVENEERREKERWVKRIVFGMLILVILLIIF